MGMKAQLTHDAQLSTLLVILVCFLYTSTGYLSWVYHLIDVGTAANPSFLTLVVAYLAQALGMGAYLLLARTRAETFLRKIALAAVGAFALLLVPSVLADNAALSVAFGMAGNVASGLVQGFYLGALASLPDSRHQGTVFGCAYGVSTLLSWLLSVPADGTLTRGLPSLAICLCLAVAAVCAIRSLPLVTIPAAAEGDDVSQGAVRELAFLAAVVVMVSAVKTLGYSFPLADLADGVSIELSRLFYGVGLVAAGLASDRDRRMSLLLCALVLVAPFLTFALSVAGVAGAPLWAFEYFLMGFYVLFRVLLFVDVVCDAGAPQLAVAGLMLGRVGDALGEGLILMPVGNVVAFLVMTTGLYAVTMVMLFALYQRRYVPVPVAEPARSERQVFEDFAARYGLTGRERDVLRLLLAEKTNAEIAGELFVTEKTVKYHVGNLLKKTGCTSRLEILAAYAKA